MNETKTAEAPLRADLAGAAVGGLVTWLQMIAERRDFTLPMPAGSWLGSAIEVLLEMLSGEFRAYGSVAAGAREAARRNEENLQSVVRTADEQESTARTTAGAAAEAGAGAARMSDAVDALCDLVDKAVRAAGDARSNLDLIAAALSGLAERLAQGDAPIVAMQRSTSGVAEFLGTLARLSRHAQLLAVNASIEAAHLGDAGARFAIVADQVRRLSTSTHESKIDVAQIVGELRQSSRLIAAAVGESTAATQGAGGQIASSTKALAQTGASISEFATTVDSVAEASATQGTALPAISAAMGELARHAEEAAASSRRASELAIDDLLVRAQTTAGRWTLRGAAGTDRSAAIGADSEFGAWIASLSAGTDPAAPADIDRDAVLRPVVDAVRSLVERVNTEQRDVLADVVAVAVAVSRNSYAWRSIAESLEGVAREVEIVRGTVRESAASAQISLASAAAMKTLVASIRSQHNDVLVLLEGALERIALIGRTVETIDTGVASMSAAASRADGIMALIETLASETDLLSLNAAIEAAHAGDHGLGFSVIAEEIRALARSTNDSTTSVSQLVAHIAGSSGELQNTISRAAASTADVMSSADGARLAIAMLRESFESAERHALAVSEIAAEQAQRLDRVSDAVNRAAAALEQKTASSTDRGRLELAVLGARAHEIAARRPLGTVVERVRDLTESLCVRLEAAIEAAIAARGFSRERLFALSYREITGSEIGSLARLFDVSLVPESGFTPAKYATPWDAAIDEAMIEVLTAGWDEALAAQISPVAIFVSDLNGLFYAYPRQKIAVWTNDPAKDLLGNRIKRLFEDEYALRVGRLGLGPNADRFGPRTPYESFRDAGCTLRRTPERPWGGYVYARDTSLVCNEVVMALYAGDLRHSTLRVCYDPSLI